MILIPSGWLVPRLYIRRFASCFLFWFPFPKLPAYWVQARSEKSLIEWSGKLERALTKKHIEVTYCSQIFTYSIIQSSFVSPIYNFLQFSTSWKTWIIGSLVQGELSFKVLDTRKQGLQRRRRQILFRILGSDVMGSWDRTSNTVLCLNCRVLAYGRNQHVQAPSQKYMHLQKYINDNFLAGQFICEHDWSIKCTRR